MLHSRTRKQIKNIEAFYRQAGIANQNENNYDKNSSSQSISKKDRVAIKRKQKQLICNKMQVKTNSDKLQSDASEDNIKQSPFLASSPNILSRSSTQSTLSLDKMLNKISILQLQDSKVINGCYGHATVIFKRPIIEGQYYLELKMLKPNSSQGKAKIKNPPTIRVGICPPDYPKNTPLGQHVSIGYKGSNGKLVHNGDEQEGGQCLKQGDVIGLCISFSPPYKYQDKSKLWEDSFIQILINGVPIIKCNKIYQCFYCPAISLFNYASVEVRVEQYQFEYCPPGYSPYSSIFQQPIKYEYLKNTSTFAQFKWQQN